MISASKYQHIIYFKSLLKVSLCINRPKQRLVCMDTRRGCRSKRSLTPWKNKKQFFFYCMGGLFAIFFYGRALCYVFLFMGVFFHCMEAFLLLFFTWGAFLLRLPPGVWLFSLCGGLFCYFFSICGDFLSSWGILCLYGFFLMGLPLPPNIYFAGACYYVTFIPCPPPSLTAAICTQQSPLQHPCSIHNNNEIIQTSTYM